MIPQYFLDFWILTPVPPPPPRTWVPPFWVGGWGGQNFFACCGRCVCIWTWVLKNFFLVYGPPNPWRESRVPTPSTPSRHPPYGPLAMRTLPFSHWIGCLVAHESFLKFDFS